MENIEPDGRLSACKKERKVIKRQTGMEIYVLNTSCSVDCKQGSIPAALTNSCAKGAR